MVVPDTRLDILIKLRNQAFLQVIDFEQGTIYWKGYVKRCKKHSHEEVDAYNKIATNEQSIKEKTIYLKQLDEEINKLKRKGT